MTHPERDQLRDFVLGLVSEASQEHLADHLENCAICLERLAEIEAQQDGGDRMTELLQQPNSEQEQSSDRYELGEEIARGGMGIVYEAYDRQLRRRVALKTTRAGSGVGVRNRRLVNEGQVTGQIQHPGVPPVYELGYLPDQRPFMAMKLIEGKPMSAVLAARTGLHESLHAVLPVFARLCETVAFAHARGIVHRDLKPSNIMVGNFGDTQVVDWGLARPVSEMGEAETREFEETPSRQFDSTLEGSVLGTPGYMAPEQALGQIDHIGPHSDVFALGSILCELLTGKPAYKEANVQVAAALAKAGDTSDAIQRLQNSGADETLIELAMKCLRVDLMQRPQNAGEVSAALNSYLEDVEKRLHDAELSRIEANTRADEAIRRRKLYVVLTAVMLLAATLSGVSAVVFREQREVEKEMRRDLAKQTKKVEAEKSKANENLLLAQTESERRRELLYAADLQLAPLLWDSEYGTADTLRKTLNSHIPQADERDLRGFEWFYFDRLLKESSIVIDESPLAVAYRPDGTLCFFSDLGEIQHRDGTTGELLRTIPTDSTSDPTVALSNDGRYLALANDRQVRVIDCDTGDVVQTLLADRLTQPPKFLQFTQDSKLLCAGSGGREKKANWWKVATGEPVEVGVQPQNRFPYNYQMVPGTNEVARVSGSYRTKLSLFKLASDRKTVTDKREIKQPAPGSITGLTVDRDGRWAAICSYASGTTRLVDLKEPKRRVEQLLHSSEVTALRFAGSNRFASGGQHGVVKVWDIDDSTDTPSINLAKTLKGHPRDIRSLAFSPDGNRLISCDDNTTRIWDLSKSRDLREQLAEQRGNCHSFAFSPDGRWVVLADTRAKKLRVRDATTFETDWIGDVSAINCAVFSSDGALLALGHPKSRITVWDTRTRQVIARLRPTKEPTVDTVSVRFSKDGSKLLAGYGILNTYNTAITVRPRVWDLKTQKVERILGAHKNACTAILLNSSGTQFVTGSHLGRAFIWDASTFEEIARLENPESDGWKSAVEDLVFSPDERLLAMASGGGKVMIWDLQERVIVQTLKGHTRAVKCLAWSKDGLTLVSGSADETVRLWNVATGRELLRLGSNQGYRAVTFSPDGKSLLASGVALGRPATIDIWRINRE